MFAQIAGTSLHILRDGFFLSSLFVLCSSDAHVVFCLSQSVQRQLLCTFCSFANPVYSMFFMIGSAWSSGARPRRIVHLSTFVCGQGIAYWAQERQHSAWVTAEVVFAVYWALERQHSL